MQYNSFLKSLFWSSTLYRVRITLHLFLIPFQVATALLVAGFTRTFWIPRFASTNSYSSVVRQSASNCRRLTYGSFRLTHMSRDDTIEPYAMAARTKTKHYYSAHNVATRVRDLL